MPTALLAILALVLALFIAGILLVLRIDSLERERHALLDRIVSYETQIALATELYVTLGFNRFIHNFKNGVLRRDADRMAFAQADLEIALQLTDRLQTLDSDARGNLARIRETLEEYRSKADLVQALIARDAPASEIDRRVSVDDSQAEIALRQVHQDLVARRDSLLQQVRGQIDTIERGSTTLAIAGALLAGIGLMATWLIVLAGRRARETLASVRRLAELDRRLAAYLATPEPTGMLPELSPAVTGQPNVEPPRVARDLAQSIDTIVARMDRQQQQLLARTEKLAKTNEELDRFAFVASHDLQEPLRKIETNIDLIHVKHAAALQGEDGMAQRLARIARSATDMRQLIDDLLRFSRSASRPLRLRRRSLAAILWQALEETGDLFAACNGEVRIDLPDDLEIAVDRGLMVQVFVNLLSNAAKFAKADTPPLVRVTAKVADGAVAIQVADNGIGFDAGFAEQIFEPFQRLHGRAAYDGNGIGLSIVRRVVERHRGTVTAASGIAPSGGDDGATFTVILPVAEGPSAARAESVTEET